MKASEVNVQLERTRGVKVGPSRDKLNEYIQTAGDLSASIDMLTGIYKVQMYPSWGKDGTVIVRQDYPLPMSVLGLSPNYSIGRSD